MVSIEAHAAHHWRVVEVYGERLLTRLAGRHTLRCLQVLRDARPAERMPTLSSNTILQKADRWAHITHNNRPVCKESVHDENNTQPAQQVNSQKCKPS